MKKLFSVIVVLLLVLALVGCDEDTLENFGTPTNESLQQQIDDLQVQLDDLQAQLDDFEDEVRETFMDELPEWLEQTYLMWTDETWEQFIIEYGSESHDDFVTEAYLYAHYLDMLDERYLEHFMSKDDYELLLESDVFIYSSIVAILELQIEQYNELETPTEEQTAFNEMTILLNEMYQDLLDDELSTILD